MEPDKQADADTTPPSTTPANSPPDGPQPSRTAVGDLAPGEKAHKSIFNGLDSAVRLFLGPAERTDGSLPIVHQHDASEDASDAALNKIEIHTDSQGHHYAQRTTPAPPTNTQDDHPEH
ncbi:hypothetical protein [Arthrobacter sp. H41]|uniref:hypothetical protein n=1 Tax=Arthrobacter sp. H41 TaxID=1312978 RepID=UPI0020A69874|nr:hypothetical protein [Arthrobacter sp. H41]